MRFRTMLVGLAVILAVSTAWAGQAGGDVRSLDVSGLNLGRVPAWNHIETPVTITSADELYDAIGNEEAAAAINGQVDFSKEILVFFRWQGSGEDVLRAVAYKTSDGIEVSYQLRPGLTVDLVPHQRIFAMPANANWTIDVVAASDSR